MATDTMKDNTLAFFAEAVNRNDFTLDITLNVKGAVITGTMVSAGKYFESLSETFEGSGDVAEALSEQLAHAGENAQSTNGGSPSFIHLEGAKVYCGDARPTPSQGDILWRGKLSEVDGFFLGKIHDNED
ncbi:gas vesicle accessory protein GvpU [Aciduricibacillus chroicocephali]|uniref:Gas vesicle accessory protein GvpU n=1 Tax=Aciduricibacillus chroicocephali TaxID=3054939 RepID=A0ABY9KUL9_9BACI|nr:gas vesicle accessory protein GvpU [Bacillaceae bacterium 44XB]